MKNLWVFYGFLWFSGFFYLFVVAFSTIFGPKVFQRSLSGPKPEKGLAFPLKGH